MEIARERFSLSVNLTLDLAFLPCSYLCKQHARGLYTVSHNRDPSLDPSRSRSRVLWTSGNQKALALQI